MGPIAGAIHVYRLYNMYSMTTKSNKKIYSANEVADYFIYLASQKVVGDSDEREGITNLKLQKILYFAQAYFLAVLGRSLFKDKIEAWMYGPVVPVVYAKYKHNGSRPITDGGDNNKISEKDKRELNVIWNIFGEYSAGKLVDITHAHAPWREASKSKSRVISKKTLTEYYKPLLGKK